jgi:hypothetical protein
VSIGLGKLVFYLGVSAKPLLRNGVTLFQLGDELDASYPLNVNAFLRPVACQSNLALVVANLAYGTARQLNIYTIS